MQLEEQVGFEVGGVAWNKVCYILVVGSSRETSSSQSFQLAYYLNRAFRIVVLESRVQGGGFSKVFSFSH